MSLSITPIRTVKVLDPRVQINQEREFGVLKGGSRITYKPVISTSYSNSSAQFTAPPPSPGIMVDRKVEIRYPVTVTINAVGDPVTAGSPTYQAGYDAFRAYPISSITNTLTVTVNNNSSSINMADVIHPLLRYNTGRDVREYEYSSTPHMQDQYQNYEDGVATNRNSLAGYNDTYYEVPRGAFPYTSLVNPNLQNGVQTTAVVDAIITEQVFLSPLQFGLSEHSSFIGVQTMDFNFTFVSNLARIWSTAPLAGRTINSIVVSLGQPTLLFTYITPKQLERIPQSVVYPFYDVQRYPTDANVAILPNGITTLNSSNIQLQSIPKRLYICVRKRNADLLNGLEAATSTDTYFGIESISVNWNNNAGLLSSASQQDLYRMCVKNGVNLSWEQWSGGPVQNSLGSTIPSVGTVGAVMCIEFGTDIGLDDIECPGLLGTYQLQYTITVKNVNQTETINPTLYTIVISEGSYTIMENRSIAQIGVVSRQDVLDSDKDPEAPFAAIEETQYGGNFYSGLKKYGSEFLKGATDVAKIAKEVAPIVLPLLLAAGKEEEDRGGAVLGGRKKRGGKLMSRDQLKKRLTY